MSEPGPVDRRQPPPKHHPATRDELFEYGQNYAVWREDAAHRPTLRVDLPDDWWVDPRIKSILEERRKEKVDTGLTLCTCRDFDNFGGDHNACDAVIPEGWSSAGKKHKDVAIDECPACSGKKT